MKAKHMVPGQYYWLGSTYFMYKYKGQGDSYVCGEDGAEDTQSSFSLKGHVEVQPDSVY